MSADIDRLEAIARAATPGGWYTESCGAPDCWCLTVQTAHPMPENIGQCVISSGSAGRNDAAHIATFSPDRVLALLAVVRAAKGVAYSNGFDAALPDKKESLLAALAALAQLEDRNG